MADESLKSTLQDMSSFISLEVGESFVGAYRGFKRVPNNFDPEKEAIELTFEINGSEKTMTSMSLPKFLVDADVNAGDNVEVTKVSKKGNSITWLVKKLAPKAA